MALKTHCMTLVFSYKIGLFVIKEIEMSYCLLCSRYFVIYRNSDKQPVYVNWRYIDVKTVFEREECLYGDIVWSVFACAYNIIYTVTSWSRRRIILTRLG